MPFSLYSSCVGGYVAFPANVEVDDETGEALYRQRIYMFYEMRWIMRNEQMFIESITSIISAREGMISYFTPL